MSATDELRRMLDERGVEWWEDAFACEHRTVFDGKDGVRYCVYQLGSMLFISSELPVTPEQAIAATLGDAFTREECEASFVHGYSLGTLPVGSDPQWDENRQTVDEHMAELGWVRERTCKREPVEGVSGICSVCGASLPEYMGWRYCPMCGARVVSE